LNLLRFGVYPVVCGPVLVQLLFLHRSPPAVPHCVPVAKPLLFQFITHGLAVPAGLGPYHTEVGEADEADEANEVVEASEATESSVEVAALGSYGTIVQVMRPGSVKADSRPA
jgi:hypothetical protein